VNPIHAWLAELKRRKVLRVASMYVVVSWAILQGADRLFPILNLPAWTLTFVAVLLLIGLPLAVIFTWAFEVTPDGIRRTADADPGTATPSPAGWIEAALLVAILAVVGLTTVQVFERPDVAVVPTVERADAQSAAPPTAAVPSTSVAVLPFTSFSEDADSNYFADGLTEELINSLAQIRELKVSGRTSSFYFKNRNEDLREIGRQLGVAHVLEGSVRRAGGKVRITAQLVATTDGFHLWSQTYDRELDDVLAIQDDVARNVAAVLEARLVPAAAPAVRAGADHEQFLRAVGLLRVAGRESVTEARALFEDLTRRDPGNVAAYAGYARATTTLAGSFLTLEFDDAVDAAQSAVDRALAIDPDSVPALVAAGGLHAMLAFRTDQMPHRREAERLFARALELAPNDPDVLTAYGSLLNDVGRPAEAYAVLERAALVDPLAAATQFQLSAAQQRLGRLAEARSTLEALLAHDADLVGVRLELAEMLMAQGQFDAALPHLERAHAARNTPRASFALAHFYLNLGMEAEALRTLDELDYAPLTAPLCEVIRLNMRGDTAGVHALARRELERTGDGLWRPLVVLNSLAFGELDAARAQLDVLAPSLLDGTVPVPTDVDADVMLMAARLLVREGDAERANAILESLLRRLAPQPHGFDPIDAKVMRARALAALGRDDAALDELRAARLQGFSQIWDFDYFHRFDEAAEFRRLREHEPTATEFARIFEQIAADNARTRERLFPGRS